MLKLTDEENAIFLELRKEASEAAHKHTAGNAPNSLIMLQIISRLYKRVEDLEGEVRFLKVLLTI